MVVFDSERYHDYGLPRRLHQSCCRLRTGGHHLIWDRNGKINDELVESLTPETDALAKVY